jgi:hypothetical protein
MQIGYCVPALHSLHQQWVPSSYQQDDLVSEHCVEPAGGGVKQEGGSGGVLQSLGLGEVTCHVPLLQRAVVRQAGRGSSPQLQWALGGVTNVPPIHGGVHAEPGTGGLAGQLPPALEPPLPATPPVLEEPPPVVLPPLPVLEEPPLPVVALPPAPVAIVVEADEVEPPAPAIEASGLPTSLESLPPHAAIERTTAETKKLGPRVDRLIGSILPACRSKWSAPGR